MKLLTKLQLRLLKRDIAKCKNSDHLAKNYPMSMLLESGEFERFANTELFRSKSSHFLYDISGNSIGEYLPACHNGKYIIVVNHEEFETSNSYAIYDRDGKCVVPHGCYMNVHVAKDYAILSMPMEEPFADRPQRIKKAEDDEMVMPSTGKTLAQTLGGSLIEPRALIVTREEVAQTKYLSVCPAPIRSYVAPYDNNIVWIAQTENTKEVSLKFDKRMYLTETYSFPYLSHSITDLFYEEEGTKHVYKIDTENRRRINLRTGQVVNLLNLRKTRMIKKDRLAEERLEENTTVENKTTEEVVEETVVEEDVSVD